MEKLKFEFDHELAAQLRASLEKSTRDAATAQYRETTEWMLRAAAKVVLGFGAFVALLFLIGWWFSS